MRKFGITISIISIICGIIVATWFYFDNQYVVSKAEIEECEKIAIDIYDSDIEGLKTLKIYSDVLDKELNVSIDENEITFSNDSKNYYYTVTISDGKLEETNLRYDSKAIYITPILGILVIVFVFLWGLVVAAVMNRMNKDALIMVLISFVLLALIFVCIIPGIL